MGDYDDFRTHAPYYPERVTEAYNRLVAVYNSFGDASTLLGVGIQWYILGWVIRRNESLVKSSIQYFQENIEPWIDSPAALKAISNGYLETYQSLLKTCGELNIEDGRWGDPQDWTGKGKENYEKSATAQAKCVSVAADFGKSLSDATFTAAIDNLNTAISAFSSVGELMAKLSSLVGEVGGNPLALLTAAKSFGSLVGEFTSLFTQLATAYMNLCLDTMKRVREIQQSRDPFYKQSGGRWALPGIYGEWSDGHPGKDSEKQVTVNASFFQRHMIRWGYQAATLDQVVVKHTRAMAQVNPKSFQWRHLQELHSELMEKDTEFLRYLGQGAEAFRKVQEVLRQTQTSYLETELSNAEAAKRILKFLDQTVTI